MTLTLFTTDDLKRLIDIFKLPYWYLEETNTLLYVGMVETEARQVRLGIDFVEEIRGLISSIESLELTINETKLAGSPTNIKTEEIVGEVKIEYGQNKDGSYGGGISSTVEMINDYKVKIQQILGIYQRKNLNAITPNNKGLNKWFY